MSSSCSSHGSLLDLARSILHGNSAIPLHTGPGSTSYNTSQISDTTKYPAGYDRDTAAAEMDSFRLNDLLLFFVEPYNALAEVKEVASGGLTEGVLLAVRYLGGSIPVNFLAPLEAQAPNLHVLYFCLLESATSTGHGKWQIVANAA